MTANFKIIFVAFTFIFIIILFSSNISSIQIFQLKIYNSFYNNLKTLE